jgi:chromosome segregation ATPase
MFKECLSRTVVSVALIMTGVLAIVHAQTTRPVLTTSTTLEDLLAEVRGLRVEINLAASASIRMQVLVARVGLQEQRINAVARQLADIRQQLPGTDPRLPGDVDRLEEMLRRAPTDLPDRQSIETNLSGMKATLQQQLSRQQALRSQEAELSALLATEQARWTEFNDRLDSLERSLPASTPR